MTLERLWFAAATATSAVSDTTYYTCVTNGCQSSQTRVVCLLVTRLFKDSNGDNLSCALCCNFDSTAELQKRHPKLLSPFLQHSREKMESFNMNIFVFMMTAFFFLGFISPVALGGKLKYVILKFIQYRW